jgi:hypothetical protein
MKTTIDMAREVYGAHTEWAGAPLERLEQLVALVRADEREACAKVCDDKHDTWRWDDEADSASGPRDCAAAIRARGENT